MKIDFGSIGKNLGNSVKDYYKTPSGKTNWGKVARDATIVTTTVVATDTAIETGREYRVKKTDYTNTIENYRNKIKQVNERLAKETISEKKREKLKMKLKKCEKRISELEMKK